MKLDGEMKSGENIYMKLPKPTQTEQLKLLRFSITPHLQIQDKFPYMGIFDNFIVDFRLHSL